MTKPDPTACVHCGGLAQHVPLPDGSRCPTARILEMLGDVRRAIETRLPREPDVNGPTGGKA